MEEVITTISQEFRFFREPYKIGETIECEDIPFLVIDIQRFEVRYQSIKVWYTCQDLRKRDFVSSSYKEDQSEKFASVKLKYDHQAFKSQLHLGTIHFIESHYYRLAEYKDITFDGTDLEISFIAKPVRPVSSNKARNKFVETRKKKLNLEIF